MYSELRLERVTQAAMLRTDCGGPRMESDQLGDCCNNSDMIRW